MAESIRVRDGGVPARKFILKGLAELHQEFARRRNEDIWAPEILASLKDMVQVATPHKFGPLPEALTARIDEICRNFEEGDRRMLDVGDLLFGEDVSAYGARATAVFNRWEQEGGGPSLPVMLAHAAEYFNLPEDSPAMRGAMMAAILAEVPNGLQYHGNEHYRKVLFHTIRLLVTHQSSDFPYQPILNRDDLVKMLIAATIHDLGHEGGDNLREGMYTPGYMEQQAFDIARPYFEALGLERDFWGEIETVIFCTDITFFAGDNSPCVRMKKIYRHFFMGGVEDEDVESMMIGKLRLFEENQKLAVMAMMLHEADIATSAGLSYEQSKIESINIMEERGVRNAGPKTLLRFLTEQLDGRMMTPAAQKLFSGEMSIIMQQAEDDIRAGVETFYG